MLKIGDALDTAHEAELVHRDVKPSNVLITEHRGRDFAYLIDFGISRGVDSTTVTATGQALGTLAYMAPERFAGAGGPRSDVYSLACVLYFMLAGQAPFVPPTGVLGLGFYLQAHLNQDPSKISARQMAQIPLQLDVVIAHGMAKDPEDRYATAGALAEAARPPCAHCRIARSGVRSCSGCAGSPVGIVVWQGRTGWIPRGDGNGCGCPAVGR